MAFEYDKLRKKKTEGEGTNFWAAYADLYTMMSIVFLLLYVAASLKSHTSNFQKNQEYKRLAEKAEDLESQIQVYNALRDNHLQHGATEREKEVYQKLMGKLDLLQDEARQEKEDLRQKARENEEKEYALNEYQRMIRNILSTNLLAKTQIQRRDLLIDRKNENIRDQAVTIATQDSEIKAKEADIKQKQSTIAANRKRIQQINADLADKIEELRENQEENRTSKAIMNKQIAKLKAESVKRIKALEHQTAETQRDLNEAQSDLQSAQARLASTEQALEDTKEQSAAEKAALQARAAAEKRSMAEQAAAEKAALQARADAEKRSLAEQAAAEKAALANQAAAEKAGLMGQLQGAKAQYQAEMARLQGEHDAKAKADREAFGKELAAAKMGAAEKARRLAEFEAGAKQREAELEGKLGDLARRMGDTEGKLARAEGEKGRALASLEGMKKEREQLAGDLKRAQELANARRELANKIQGELKKAGLHGTVDGKTGDVTLAFGEEYFDTGSADLKPNMRNILERFMPGYSKSLFNDPKIAENIENVEVVGFASSTYKGRYVPPGSLRPEDREAVNYNLKLSFNRANAIFKHIFDTNKMQFPHQRELLPKMKVVGRGYLPDGKAPSDFPPGMKESEFCKKYNCKQAQKVIIKFNLKN